MELKDIIKKESDRLFIVDPECYIIYTGDSLQDEKPFIRIGNWMDLPVEAIPLIENIIITDLIIGNPAHEQFNIDVNSLATNRYIGSRNILRRYLDFQNIFGLDLKNAHVIDIDKDLPHLSKEQIISSKHSFIGIFYNNGNFRIVKNEDIILDLKKIEGTSLLDINIHDIISKQNKKTGRYSNSGIILINNLPLFYKNRYFTSYLFPSEYYENFVSLNIDPAKIREIILPSVNLQNIIKFVKWKNHIKGQIKIISDFSKPINLLQKLFPDSSISIKQFKNLSYNTGDGLNIQNYDSTFNFKLTYKNTKPSNEDIIIAFIKGFDGIQKIIKEKLDGIFINYLLYKDSNVLLKSVQTPIVILLDRENNISEPKGNSILLYSGIHYEFLKFTNHEELIHLISKHTSNKNLLPNIINGDTGKIEKTLFTGLKKNKNQPLDKIIEFYNLLSLLKIHLDSTSNKNHASLLLKFFQRLKSQFDKKSILTLDPLTFKIVLAFLNNSIYQFIEKIDNSIKNIDIPIFNTISEEKIECIKKFHNLEKLPFYERIINDRERFLKLINLYSKSLKKDNRIPGLVTVINERKDQYSKDDIDIDNIEIKKRIISFRYTKILEKLKKNRNYIIIIIILLLLIPITFKSLDLYMNYKEKVEKERLENEKIEFERGEKERLENEKIEFERSAKERLENKRLTKEVIVKYNIHVTDLEILLYANRVALKNGYDKINIIDLKKRNPHWIYPGNIFILLDEKKIKVKKGDTLWDISHDKLRIIHIEFYKTIDTIKNRINDGKDIRIEIKKAKSIAFTKKHFNIISKIIKNNKIQ